MGDSRSTSRYVHRRSRQVVCRLVSVVKLAEYVCIPQSSLEGVSYTLIKIIFTKICCSSNTGARIVETLVAQIPYGLTFNQTTSSNNCHVALNRNDRLQAQLRHQHKKKLILPR